MSNRPPLHCIGCDKRPDELRIYVELAEEDGYADAGEYVWFQEGTLNRENGHFACDQCYINMGMPTSPGGWKAS